MIALVLALAAAQGSPPNSFPGSRKDAERAMAAFAACEVKSAKGRAAALAYTREVAGTPSDYPQRLIKSPCAARGTSLRFQPELFRMALFPALYARDFGKAPAADIAAVAPLNIPAEFDGTPAEQTVLVRNFGDCVVRRDPSASRTLVLSRLYSAEETAAINALKPTLSQCVAEGQELRFSRSIVHGAVGEALYKLTTAATATKVN